MDVPSGQPWRLVLQSVGRDRLLGRDQSPGLGNLRAEPARHLVGPVRAGSVLAAREYARGVGSRVPASHARVMVAGWSLARAQRVRERARQLRTVRRKSALAST